ncbi:MAG: hypothetical protein ACTSO9_21740 [Candidatus Helarchaeota archaeon]
MRIDPTCKITYQHAIKYIETVLKIKLREVPVYVINKNELIIFLPQKRKYLLNFVKGFYLPKKDSIFIVEGFEEDIQTFIHETLHSNSIFHLNNSPIWISEGITSVLTDLVLKKMNITSTTDFYLDREKKFWLNKLKTQQKQIIQAYFSNNLNDAIKILKNILKTQKNIIELSFNEFIK